jgi:hypothetical protein
MNAGRKGRTSIRITAGPSGAILGLYVNAMLDDVGERAL